MPCNLITLFNCQRFGGGKTILINTTVVEMGLEIKINICIIVYFNLTMFLLFLSFPLLFLFSSSHHRIAEKADYKSSHQNLISPSDSQFLTKNNTRITSQRGGLAILPCSVTMSTPATVSLWVTISGCPPRCGAMQLNEPRQITLKHPPGQTYPYVLFALKPVLLKPHRPKSFWNTLVVMWCCWLLNDTDDEAKQ